MCKTKDEKQVIEEKAMLRKCQNYVSYSALHMAIYKTKEVYYEQ